METVIAKGEVMIYEQGGKKRLRLRTVFKYKNLFR